MLNITSECVKLTYCRRYWGLSTTKHELIIAEYSINIKSVFSKFWGNKKIKIHWVNKRVDADTCFVKREKKILVCCI